MTKLLVCLVKDCTACPNQTFDYDWNVEKDIFWCRITENPTPDIGIPKDCPLPDSSIYGVE